jgi:hypothetical protein
MIECATKGYILSDQGSLFGHNECIGFGMPSFHVKEIERDLANKLIVQNHYSGKFYNATYIHLGVFKDGNIKGVLQLGYAMNPASQESVVANTGIKDYLELNRMWLHDDCPKNSESMAISFAIKLIKKKRPNIRWIQSFADERCGKYGIVYQAANFGYYGEHSTTFWTLDNEVYHNSIKTSKKAGPIGYEKLNSEYGLKNATSENLRQFRYIYFIHKSAVNDCLLKRQDYPKHYEEITDRLDKQKKHSQS